MATYWLIFSYMDVYLIEHNSFVSDYFFFDSVWLKNAVGHIYHCK